MILSEDQICRYMSQMLMPEINRKGQEKLMCSRVLFYSEKLWTAALALYYLVAAGIGEVYCRVDASINFQELKNKLSDLNSDTEVFFTSEDLPGEPHIQATSRVICGRPRYVLDTINHLLQTDKNENFVPTVVSLFNGWHGAFQTFTKRPELEKFIFDLTSIETGSELHINEDSNRLSGYFSSLMAVIEHLKLALGVGRLADNALYHNLATMEFTAVSSTHQLARKLDSSIASTGLPHEKLADSRVLIAGCGGLGSSAAYVLASIGIGKLGLLDPGTVELGNLSHQIMHASSRLGMPKAQSSEIFLREIYPEMKLEVYNSSLSDLNLNEIVSCYDIIIGCMDSKHGGYLLKEACLSAGKPVLQARALDISALATSMIPGEGHCYHCVFPEAESSDPTHGCTEKGMLGPVPGVMGVIQATEAIKLLSAIGQPLKDRMLLFDVFETDLYVVSNVKDSYCEICNGK